jgi:ElaB/YqjD/DUF883 family membrane-anchored ribosome-binding protein
MALAPARQGEIQMTESEQEIPTFETGEEPVEEGAGGRATEVMTEIGEVAQQVVRALGDGVGDAEDSIREGLVQAEETVRKHPLAALGVAAGVGFLVGVIVSRGRE